MGGLGRAHLFLRQVVGMTLRVVVQKTPFTSGRWRFEQQWARAALPVHIIRDVRSTARGRTLGEA